jgi:hypothetical protein
LWVLEAATFPSLLTAIPGEPCVDSDSVVFGSRVETDGKLTFRFECSILMQLEDVSDCGSLRQIHLL